MEIDVDCDFNPTPRIKPRLIGNPNSASSSRNRNNIIGWTVSYFERAIARWPSASITVLNELKERRFVEHQCQ